MTIKDIARLANVSTSTVSKILNNKDDDISKKTRENVLEIVKKYQYIPYSKVKKQFSGRSFLVALIIPREYEYRDALVSSIEKACIDKGYNTLLYFTDNIDEEEKYINILSGKNLDAVLLYNMGNPQKAIKTCNKSNIPLILLKKEKDYKYVAQVYINYNAVGHLATRHVIKHGHKNIGVLLSNSSNSEAIREGYTTALFQSDILYDESKVFIGEGDLEAGNIGAHQLINMNITAIVCENEKIACGVYQACNRYGVLIPKDISIVSASGMGFSDVLNPRLDTVNLGIHDMGVRTMGAIEDIIEKKVSPHNYNKEVELSVIHCESVTYPYDKGYGRGGKIVVVGSMNMDATINVDKLPSDGETLISSNISLLPGGKGANQAIGAGRLGGKVYAVGRLGNDNDGKKIYQNLNNNSVKLDGVSFDNILPTGKAYINVAKKGESTIVVYPGANSNLDIYQLRKSKKLFESAEYCLLSLEISKNAWKYTLDLCEKTGTKVIVKPATIEMLEEDVLKKIDFLIPNEKEINYLVKGEMSINEKADIIHQKGVENIIVTLGRNGCYLRNKECSVFFEAAPFEAVDTTGASDAFVSALAVFLSDGKDLITAIKFAVYSAGISITRLGAQPSMPDAMTLNIYKDDILKLNMKKL